MKKKRRTFEEVKGYLYILPWIIGFLMFQLIPLINSLRYSLTNIKLGGDYRFIGLQNYIRMFTSDVDLFNSMWVTIKYIVMVVPAKLIFALAVAMILSMKLKGIRLFRTMYYLPSILGGSVAISALWRVMFMKTGIVNNLLGTNINWLGDPKYALFTIGLIDVWQFGSSMLIFLSALKQIPGSLYESAKVDGANGFVTFWKITIPMLTPTIFFNLILQIINGFRVFTESYVITDGGPLDSTLSYVLYLYRRAFTYFDMGYSCALAWVLVAIVSVFTIILFKTQKNWVYYEAGRE